MTESTGSWMSMEKKKKLEATPGFLSVYDEIGTILDTEKGNENSEWVVYFVWRRW